MNTKITLQVFSGLPFITVISFQKPSPSLLIVQQLSSKELHMKRVKIVKRVKKSSPKKTKTLSRHKPTTNHSTTNTAKLPDAPSSVHNSIRWLFED